VAFSSIDKHRNQQPEKSTEIAQHSELYRGEHFLLRPIFSIDAQARLSPKAQTWYLRSHRRPRHARWRYLPSADPLSVDVARQGSVCTSSAGKTHLDASTCGTSGNAAYTFTIHTGAPSIGESRVLRLEPSYWVPRVHLRARMRAKMNAGHAREQRFADAGLYRAFRNCSTAARASSGEP